MATNEEIEALAEKAGLGKRSVKKLLEANSPTTTSTPTQPRGHGSATRPREVAIGDL